MNIFLDDERTPEGVTWVRLPDLTFGEHWDIVRSYDEFVNLVNACALLGKPVVRVSFDHDLAPEHYPTGPEHLGNHDSGTGYHCALHLAKVIIDEDWPLPEYTIHSMNPVAPKRIHEAMEDVKRYRNVFK